MENSTTFGNLDTYMDLMNNQSASVHEEFVRHSLNADLVEQAATVNKEKAYAMGYSINNLINKNEQINKSMESVEYMLRIFEIAVNNLEKIIRMLDKRNPVDVTRHQIYDLAEKVFCSLSNCHDDVECLEYNTEHYRKNNQTPVEMVTAILNNLLICMAHVETGMEQIKTDLNWIHVKKSKLGFKKL